MGIVRREVNFEFVKPLKGRERELAVEILAKNLPVPYYAPIYSIALERLEVPGLEAVLVEQYETALKSRNYQSALALASEIKARIFYDFKPLIDEILDAGTDKEKYSAIWITYKLIPDHCLAICVKYLDSPNYELRQAAFYSLMYHAGLGYAALKDKQGNYLSRWDKDENGKDIYYHGYEPFLSDRIFQNKELFQKKKDELLALFNLSR